MSRGPLARALYVLGVTTKEEYLSYIRNYAREHRK